MNRIIHITLFLCLVAGSSCNSNKNTDNQKQNIDSLSTLSGLLVPDTLRFDVDNVPIATSKLAEIDAEKLINNKIGKKSAYIPQIHQNLKLVPADGNALIATLQESYDQHRPLALSPDVIWLAICQGVSIHINQNIKSLKSRIFTEDNTKELSIRNDSLEYGGKHWQDLISSFADETKKYTKGDFYSFFVSDFSTTSYIEKTAYQIALLESYKQMFTYVAESGCGIVSVTLLGKKEDWTTIYGKLDKLKEIGLADWAEELKPIIKEFINAYDGKVNKSFWGNIYKSATEYNAFYISGWCIKFFPYIIDQEETTWNSSNYDEEKGGVKTTLNYKINPFLKGDNYLLSTLSTDNFPSGLSEIDIVWNNHFKGTSKKMSVYSGFFAIKQFDDKTLMPFISWAIAYKDAKEITESYRLPFTDPQKPYEYWSPHVTDKPKEGAVYDIKQFKTQKESLDFITKHLEKRLANNKGELQNIKVTFTVLVNGKIANIEVTDSQNIKLKNIITQELEKLPQPWFPALSNPQDVLELMDDDKDIENMKVKVNSKVEVVLFTTNENNGK
ncbi:MAG: DUF4419 domain-containing protein [Dysgonomonas sp.]